MKIKTISKVKSLVILVLGVLLASGIVYAGATGITRIFNISGDYNEAGFESNDSLSGLTTGIEYFDEGIVEGGLTNELSVVDNSSDSATSTAMDICQYKSIEYTVTEGDTGVPANTLYLPDSDELINACLYTENDSWVVYFSNENTTAATTTTISIGNGSNMELLEADGSDVVIPGAEDAILHFRNAGAGVVKTTVTSVRSGD